MPDEKKQEAFGAHVTRIINDAFSALFLSVGHKLGLFDTLAELPPSTSAEVAGAAGLDERHVREWLGGMVVAGVLEYDPEAGTFSFPEEHRAFLTREAGPDNMAFFTQYIGLAASIEDELVEVFRNGGGVPYSSYPTFQRVQAEETARVYDTSLVEEIIPAIPGLRDRLEAGVEALDVGTGEGRAVNIMARSFPNSRFTGTDISEEGISAAKHEAEAWGLTNASFEVRDAADIPGAFDVITAFDVIHDLAWPTKTLAAIAGGLKDGGELVMVDIAASSKLEENLDHPFGPLLYGFSLFYCMTTSAAQGGEALGTLWGEQVARRKLAEAGFTSVETIATPEDPINLFYIARRD